MTLTNDPYSNTGLLTKQPTNNLYPNTGLLTITTTNDLYLNLDSYLL